MTVTLPEYVGVVQKRHSTDKIFFLLIIAMWVAMTIIGIQGMQSGNPDRLISPIDDQGNICGISSGVKDKKYFYSVLTTGTGVCISSSEGCPNNNTNFKKSVAALTPNSFYCLNYIYDAFGTSGVALEHYINSACYSGGSYIISSNCGCMIKLASESFLNRCSITTQSYANQFITQAFRNQAFTWMDDIWAAKAIIFGYGIGFSFVASFIYVFLLRFYFISSIVTWSLLLLVLICFSIMCYLAYTTADHWDKENPRNHSNDEIIALQVASAVLAALSVLLAVLMILSRKSIQISLKMMSMTAEAIEDMPTIVFIPLVKVVAVVCFLVPWAMYCAFIASSGTFSTVVVSASPISYSYLQYTLSSQTQGRLWFMLFCYLWSTEFIMAIGTLIISIAVANWYFSKPEDRTWKGGRRDLNLGIWHTLRYHLGTAALGSLIVAIVTFIRAVVLYLEKKFKKVAGDNCITKFLFCCVNCCMWCLEQCIRYIAQKAYIQTAIHGYSLCWAAKEAVMLIARNPLRVFLLDMLCGLALGLGKLMIVCICGSTTYYILNRFYMDQLSGIIAPTILTMVISFSVATAFSAVFHSVAATMIQCYITDEEKNGSPIYASGYFKKFVDDSSIDPEEFQKLTGETVDESKAKGNEAISAEGSASKAGATKVYANA